METVLTGFQAHGDSIELTACFTRCINHAMLVMDTSRDREGSKWFPVSKIPANEAAGMSNKV